MEPSPQDRLILEKARAVSEPSELLRSLVPSVRELYLWRHLMKRMTENVTHFLSEMEMSNT
jgi:hypothetical protein